MDSVSTTEPRISVNRGQESRSRKDRLLSMIAYALPWLALDYELSTNFAKTHMDLGTFRRTALYRPRFDDASERMYPCRCRWIVQSSRMLLDVGWWLLGNLVM